MLKRWICVKQHDSTDCGAACIATISKHYKLKLPIAKIREIAGTDNDGTSVFGIMTAAEKLGFSVNAVRAEEKDLYEEVYYPVIAHTIVDENMPHFMVIHKVDKKNIIVADPAKGIVKYEVEEFLKIWTGVLVLLKPTVEFKTGDNTKGFIERFSPLLKAQKRIIFDIFLASMLYTFIGMLSAFYFKFLIDDILPKGLLGSLHTISIGVILLYVTKIMLNGFRTYLLLYFSQKIDISMILGYFNKVMDLPMNFFGTRKVGEITSRFTDAGKIRDALSIATVTIMIDTLMAIGGGVVLYVHSEKLFKVAILMIFIYCLVALAFNRPIKQKNKDMMEENAQLNSHLIESINGIETIKIYNHERQSKFLAEKKFVKLLRSIFKMGQINNFRDSLTMLITLVGNAIILWVGAYNVIKGDMSVGELLVFNSLLIYFIDPIKNLINLQPIIQKAVVASDRLGDILDLEEEKDETEDKKIIPKKIKGDIEFKNIDFRYGTRDLSLEDINIKIKEGEKIAFVGESGSGKTTLVKLILRLFKAEKGEILIDGNNIENINIEALRDKIAYVNQETFLFSDTVYNNLIMGLENRDMENVIDCCKKAESHDFITRLPAGYNTKLDENGRNLSGGQRQRLSIARALLKNPDILILDEATSNLDSITEKAIEESMKSFESKITTLVIAHRLSTVMNCDKIFVMEKGKIIEEGTHEELLIKKGKYFELWRGQSGVSEDLYKLGEAVS